MHARRKGPLVVAMSAPEKADHACAFAVEAAPESDEFEFLRDRLREPESRLDRLGAAREQLEVGDPVRQQRTHQIEKARPALGGEAAESGPVELFLEALDVVRMTVAHAADRDSGDEVEIFGAVDVGDGAALGVVHHDLRKERDRLKSRRHHPGLLVEESLGPGAGHSAALADAFDRRRAAERRKVIHEINSLLRRRAGDAAKSARPDGRRSHAPPVRGRARSSATR